MGLKSPDPTTIPQLDECVCEYADFLFFEGHPGSMGDKLRATLADHLPEVGRVGSLALPRFSRSRQAWNRLAPGRTRDGLPWRHLCLLIQWLVARNLRHHAVALVVMFVCYLRPSGSLAVKVEDVIPPTRSAPWTSLLLHPQENGTAPKTGEFDDGVDLPNRWAPWFGAPLVKYARKRGPQVLLWDLTYLDVKDKFQQAMGGDGLKDPSVYWLRHGGASQDLAQKCRSIEEVEKRGRWSTDAAAKRYDQALKARG